MWMMPVICYYVVSAFLSQFHVIETSVRRIWNTRAPNHFFLALPSNVTRTASSRPLKLLTGMSIWLPNPSDWEIKDFWLMFYRQSCSFFLEYSVEKDRDLVWDWMWKSYMDGIDQGGVCNRAMERSTYAFKNTGLDIQTLIALIET